MRHSHITYFILITLLAIIGCNSEHHGEGHQTIQSKLNEISVDSIEYDVSTAQILQDMQKVLAEVPESERKFFIPERSSMIKSFPCTNCHSKSLSELQNLGEVGIKKAHWNIKLVHAGEDVMNCVTCHNDKDLNQLQTIAGKGLSIDHSYKLCGQCHSTQYKDWVGGAHGKRLGGWAPPRVVNSCVNCHNPHQPAFEMRWPARLNTVKLKEQSSD